ncbi:efflux RND transporter periplasmic adaptor subunit [Pseudooceanicola sp. 216_PA32_1]|uniref:Efflux RND transporter periplasmic adaptor subunit n=1 Tax=Pseudooceanicola pacificus TaxID=2676438 RepID=A0A844VYR1_9RHOB|nr:efflux RND transporter periplasmic adaptor subunit [Pseudooceanicola pacificus]MWB76886.1 efflux RND transporter periplasmic adaptor subunit [Pseudooceanicola pacificus]
MINFIFQFPQQLGRIRSGFGICFLCLTVPAAHAQGVDSECIVRAEQIARIGASTRGVIASIVVDRADRVTGGQVIAELEASEEDSQITLAKLRLGSDIALRLARLKAETAEANAERLTTLVGRSLVPKAEQEEAVLAARTARLEEEEALLEHRMAEAELAAAEAARERKRIRAPFDGVVTEKLLSVGELYTEQGPVVTVVSVDPLHVEAYLPVSRRAEVAEGRTATLTLETGDTVEATVDVIDPVLDAATGTFGIRLILPNPDGAILAGQSCRLRMDG